MLQFNLWKKYNSFMSESGMCEDGTIRAAELSEVKKSEFFKNPGRNAPTLIRKTNSVGRKPMVHALR